MFWMLQQRDAPVGSIAGPFRRPGLATARPSDLCCPDLKYLCALHYHAFIEALRARCCRACAKRTLRASRDLSHPPPTDARPACCLPAAHLRARRGSPHGEALQVQRPGLPVVGVPGLPAAVDTIRPGLPLASPAGLLMAAVLLSRPLLYIAAIVVSMSLDFLPAEQSDEAPFPRKPLAKLPFPGFRATNPRLCIALLQVWPRAPPLPGPVLR